MYIPLFFFFFPIPLLEKEVKYSWNSCRGVVNLLRILKVFTKFKTNFFPKRNLPFWVHETESWQNSYFVYIKIIPILIYAYIFFQAALRKIAAVRQKEEFKKLGAEELVEARLWDAFLAHSSKRESYVWSSLKIPSNWKSRSKDLCLELTVSYAVANHFF